MKCEICETREAVIHIQQIIGNKKVELYICEECAKERGITTGNDKIELSISGLLTGLVDIQDVHENKRVQKVCPSCGLTLTEFKDKGKLGCSECYSAFGKEIRSLLHKMYGKTQHFGKFPHQLRTYKTFLIDVEKLKEELKKVVTEEDYEKAAVLRDRISELQREAEKFHV